MSLTVILGGARSGKSAFGVQCGKRHDGNVAYIATASRSDEDMADRIDRHQSERPPEWTTIEEQFDLKYALKQAPQSLIIIDCLTLWTSNLMTHGRSDAEIEALTLETAQCAAGRSEPTIVISNEVGMGVHPGTPLGRRYRDVLGRVNRQWVAAASQSFLLVAGRAIELRDPEDIVIDGQV